MKKPLQTCEKTRTGKNPRTSKVEKAFSMSIPCSFPLKRSTTHKLIPPPLRMLKLLLQSQA